MSKTDVVNQSCILIYILLPIILLLNRFRSPIKCWKLEHFILFLSCIYFNYNNFYILLSNEFLERQYLMLSMLCPKNQTTHLLRLDSISRHHLWTHRNWLTVNCVQNSTFGLKVFCFFGPMVIHFYFLFGHLVFYLFGSLD